MASACIVNGQPGRRSKSRAQHFNVFFDESVLSAAQQPHDLPLGNLDAQIGQLRGKPRDRDLTLMILAQDKALEVRPEMAADPLWRRRDHSFARWKHPALAPIADRPRHDDHILDDEVFVALETRAARQAVRREDAGLVGGERCPLGATAPLAPAAFRAGCLRRLLHAAGLEFGASLQTLEPRNLLAKRCVLCLQPGVVLQSLQQQRLQLFEPNPGNVAGRFGHAPRGAPNESAVSPTAQRLPGLLPLLPFKVHKALYSLKF